MHGVNGMECDNIRAYIYRLLRELSHCPLPSGSVTGAVASSLLQA